MRQSAITRLSRSPACTGISWTWYGSSFSRYFIYGEHMASGTGQQHPIRLYLTVWGLLFVLSTLSYLVDYFHFQGYARWGLIILFMLLKAGLIVAVFMHM